jgi:putative flippase GtrA
VTGERSGTGERGRAEANAPHRTAALTLRARVVRYGVAGLIATAVYFAAVTALVEVARLAPVPAAGVATVVVMITSYVINRAWVFHTTQTHAASFARFAIATLLSIGLNAGLMHIATTILGWSYLLGAALTTVVVPPVNFVVNYFWAFRGPRQGA